MRTSQAAPTRHRSFWWDRARCATADVHDLEAVLLDLDGTLEIDWGPDDYGRGRMFDGEIVPRPGLLDLIASLRDAGIRIVVATTAPRALAEPLVRLVIGDGVVEAVVTGDDVSPGESYTQVYARALDELGINAESALAIEDSVDGLRAAAGAGLATVVVPTDDTAAQDFTGAAAVLRSFDGALPLSAQCCTRVHNRWWINRRS
jgi:HAD superfamily hydrolase (TIGR01509 family)